MAPPDPAFLNPPLADEIEVSLWGPGFGECLALHLCDQYWVVVDSCLEEGEPVAERYLRSLGLNPPDVIKLILASHWHDDHVKGLSTMVKNCANARFAMSAALKQRELVRVLAALGGGIQSRASSGLDTLVECVQTLRARNQDPEWVGYNRILRDDQNRGVHLRALSPGDAQVTRATEAFARMLPEVNGQKLRLPQPNPNELSIALWVQAGVSQALLGADLEKGCWAEFLAAPERPTIEAENFKVSHHGAESGHHDPMWSDCLKPRPLAILAPFVNGNILLPTDADQQRIRSLTSQAYLTAAPTRHKSKHGPQVAKAIRQSGVQVYQRSGQMGHIRLRCRLGATAWSVERTQHTIDLHRTA